MDSWSLGQRFSITSSSFPAADPAASRTPVPLTEMHASDMTEQHASARSPAQQQIVETALSIPPSSEPTNASSSGGGSSAQVDADSAASEPALLRLARSIGVSDMWAQARRWLGYHTAEEVRQERERVSAVRRDWLASAEGQQQVARVHELLELWERPTQQELQQELDISRQSALNRPPDGGDGDSGDEDWAEAWPDRWGTGQDRQLTDRSSAALSARLAQELQRPVTDDEFGRWAWQPRPSLSSVLNALFFELGRQFDLFVVLDWKEDTEAICRWHSLLGRRFGLEQRLMRIQRRVLRLEREVQAHSNWVPEVIHLCLLEFQAVGIQAWDASGGDSYDILLIQAERVTRAQQLVAELSLSLGESADTSPFGNLGPWGNAVSELDMQTSVLFRPS